jgi:hypothetical protein
MFDSVVELLDLDVSVVELLDLDVSVVEFLIPDGKAGDSNA